MTRDRQVFETIVLPNGITIYHYPMEMELPFSRFRINVPFGSAHNHGNIIPGTAHFLEHITFSRSRLYPDRRVSSEVTTDLGAVATASTYLRHTMFEGKCATEDFNVIFPLLFSHAFEPVLTEEDISRERGAIASERRKKEVFFPGTDEISKYLMTEWMDNQPVHHRQRLGWDEDLARIDKTALESAHRHYFSPRIFAVVGGKADIDLVKHSLGHLSLKDAEIEEAMHPVRWASREYREVPMESVARVTLYEGGITERPQSIETSRALNFITNFAGEFNHGPLYRWLRHENDWTYDIEIRSIENVANYRWEMRIPLNRYECVAQVRDEWRDRLRRALSNQWTIDREINRVRRNRIYAYQTIENIMKPVENDLELYGRIVSECEWDKLLELCRDTKWLVALFDQYFAPEVSGEICLVPANKSVK